MKQSLKFCPLASGSKGNAIYLKTQELSILIDAGISTKATKQRLAEIGVSIDEIDAILVTHDHTDHIQGLKVMAFRLGIPVLANAETAKGIVDTFGACPKFKIFSTGDTFEFGDIRVHPFTIPHDTLDPVAFTIESQGYKLGFCTDLGYVTSVVRHNLKDCDYLYLEANHEPSMVHASARPMVYKQRVLGKTGHLSNQDSAKLLADISHDNLKHVHLSHLSSECNHPKVALEKINEFLQKRGIALNMSIAHQEKVSNIVDVNNPL